MKKILALALTLMLAFAAVSALADIKADVEAGEQMTTEQLLEKALAETGVFTAAGNTSRIVKAAAAFQEKYGIQTEASNLKDQEIYNKLDSTVIDMVMIQDGANLLDYIDLDKLFNFVPASVRDQIADADREPALVQQYINKVFIYNKLGDDVPAIRNVWELTAPEMKGRVIFKSPTLEKVNQNFLVMLTSDYWAEELAEAYKAWKGEDIVLGDYPNAGYKWIAEFLANVTFIKSDTTIAEEVSQDTAAGKIGLFVLSKLRAGTVITDNLTVAQYDATEKDYVLEPFGGFMYPMYVTVSAKANRPYTAMLFIDFLMSEEGFSFWNDSIGAYSPNPNIPHKEGDLDLDVWKNTLVMEDPLYIQENIEVEDFIRLHCQ